MCGMRVCEWTQHELTLEIRFMGEEYDPGRRGRNGEQDSKAGSRGGGMRWREKARRVVQMPRREMRCLISTGPVTVFLSGGASDAEPMKTWTPPAAQSIHYDHTLWSRRQQLIVTYIFIFDTVILLFSIPLSYDLLPYIANSLRKILFVQKFPAEAFGFTWTLCFIFKSLLL